MQQPGCQSKTSAADGGPKGMQHNHPVIHQQTMGLLDYSSRPRCRLLFRTTAPLLSEMPCTLPAASLALLLLALLHKVDALLDAASKLRQHFVVIFLLQVVHGA